jgi:hypothetical protein
MHDQLLPDRSARTWYLAGIAAAFATSFVTIWTMIVRDDGNGLGFFGAVFTAAACAFVAKGRAAEMARAMLATAVVQALFATLIATAPITEEPVRIVMLSGAFCLLWMAAAGLFHRSAAAGRANLHECSR